MFFFFFFSHLTRRLTQYCSREYYALLLNPNSRYPPGPAVRPCDNAVIKILFKSPNTWSYARQVARVRQRGVRPRSSSTSRRHSSRTAQDSPRVRGTAGARVRFSIKYQRENADTIIVVVLSYTDTLSEQQYETSRRRWCMFIAVLPQKHNIIRIFSYASRPHYELTEKHRHFTPEIAFDFERLHFTSLGKRLSEILIK